MASAFGIPSCSLVDSRASSSTPSSAKTSELPFWVGMSFPSFPELRQGNCSLMAAMEEKLLRGPLPLWKLFQKYIGPGVGAGSMGKQTGLLTPARPGWPQGQGLV